MENRNDTPRFQSLRVIGSLMVREMITRYGRSWGGYIWAILEPVAIILVLALAFSQVIRTPALGSSFILFYATGYIPFHFFLESSTNTGGAVTFNRQLMLLPMVTPVDAVIARFFLSVLTLIVVAMIVFSALAIYLPEPMTLSLEYIVYSFGTGAILGLGVGTMNSVLFEFIPIWRQLWGIISRPLFIISGVFFTFDSLPSNIQAILWWNPLVHVVGEARRGFYQEYEGSYVMLLYPLGIGVVLFLLGGALLLRHRTRIVETR